jgi:hypothetical protein
MSDIDSLTRDLTGLRGEVAALKKFFGIPVATLTSVLPPGLTGATAYQNSNDANEGPYWYTGTTWQPAWNTAWGWKGETHSTPGLTNVTTITDVLTLNWTCIATRRYCIFSQGRATMTGAGGSVTMTITDSSNTNLAAQDSVTITAVNNTATMHPMMYPRTLSAGARADKIRLTSTAAVSTSGEWSVWVFDVGPDTAPA